MLARALVVAAIVWPVTLVAATVERTHAPDNLLSRAVYLAASHICHQRVDRSFAIDGTPLPVCGRCLGLYLAAPIGALIGWSRRRRPFQGSVLARLAIAAVPTAITLVIEWSRISPLSNMIRALAALPLGAALAFVVVREAANSKTGK